MVRLGVVGLGVVSGTHIKAAKSLDSCELVCVCDADAERVRRASEEHGVPGYTSLDEMLAKERPDGVTVCTPHRSHPAVASAAFAAGCHVLTEKPMAVTVEDAERMIAEAEEAKRVLAVVLQHRWEPVNARARELVASGALGEVRRVLMVNAMFRPDAYYRSDAWRGTWKGEGGGVLVNQAAHALDLLIWIAGMMPDRVTGQVETALHEIEVEDRASALLHFANGATGYVHCSTCEAPGSLRIEVAGDRGRLALDLSMAPSKASEAAGSLRFAGLDASLAEFSRTSSEVLAEPAGEWKDLTPAGTALAPTGHAAVVRDFVEAISAGREPAVPGREGLKSLELANAIVFSSHRNEGLDLPVPRRAYTEFVGLLTGRPTRRRRRRTTTRVPSREAPSPGRTDRPKRKPSKPIEP